MAPSLRDLIDFLLAEIALCGDQGASPSDILSFIDVFYSKFTKDASTRTQVIDRRFQEKVWSWLTKNPEVSVGKDREGNQLTLEEAEKHQHEAKSKECQAQGSSSTETNTTAIRVFVSKERTWLAITGHEPDETKVFPMEFALLSLIASRKSNGIAQPELIRLSGQDKRSVPKRTDVLQQKGYIEKRAIQIKGTRTSLCTLRRFLNHEAQESDQGPEPNAVDNKVIDFQFFTNKLFEILREYKIIARADLKDLLGFTDRWRWRVLSRALRKFERIGVLKRVKALSQYADTMKKFHPCVMLVRDPSEKDFEMFHEFSKNIYSNIERDGNTEFEEDAEAADTAGGVPTSSEGVGVVKREEDVEASGRTLPIWNPDRNIHNQIFDVINGTGTTGSTNLDVIRSCFGAFYRRPMENTLARLVECWQLSQPLYLRHLAIVRDTALQRTITHYVHYSATNFAKLVEAGEASWEAVEFVPRNAKSNNVRVPSVDATPQLDAYGLPLEAHGTELVKNGEMSLLECMLVVKPPNYLLSSSDARAVQLEDGTYSVSYVNKKIQGETPQSIKPSRRKLAPYRDSPVRAKVEYEDLDDLILNEVNSPQPKRTNKTRRDSEPFRGMSEKEKLEALGLDETYTEYKILLIDRPGPGVYVTPRGRRRPAGKRQGRPRTSRIAVFKSPKLLTLPWFKKDTKGSGEGPCESGSPQMHENGHIIHTPDIGDLVEANNHSEMAVSRGTKRPFQAPSFDARPDSEDRIASKQRRIHGVGNVPNISRDGPSTEGPVLIADNQEQSATNDLHNGRKRRRPQSPKSGKHTPVNLEDGSTANRAPALSASEIERSRSGIWGKVDDREIPSKRLRLSTQDLRGEGSSRTIVSSDKDGNMKSSSNHPASSVATDKPQNYPECSPRKPESKLSMAKSSSDTQPEDTLTDKSHSAEESVPPTHRDMKNDSSHHIVDEAMRTEPSTPFVPQNNIVSHLSQTSDGPVPRPKRSKLPGKGGSVSFLRKNIIIDIIEKAGGAFPMGTELWYPFMTAWMRTKYKEKPDLRTLRTSVKQLIEAGKLRQQTFCGKDSKGIMVTKTIICMSNLLPDDPIIKDLQEKMLASNLRYYFPPGVEVDPNLTKSGHKGTPRKESRPFTDIPVESGLTVQLHQKPALVLAMEKRRGQSIQRKLLQRIEMENDMYRKRPSGVVRLLSIQRPGAEDPSMRGMTSISRPDQAGEDSRKRGTRRPRMMTGQGPDGQGRRLKRLVIPISLMGPYAMFMNPKQAFHSVTGTFSTNAGLAALIVAKASAPPPPIPQKRGPRLPQSLDELFSQTRRRTVHPSGNNNRRSNKFFRDSDEILRWELQNEELLQQKAEGLQYINQTINDSFETVPFGGNIRFDGGETEFPRHQAGPTMTTRHQTRLSSPFVSFEPSPSLPPTRWEQEGSPSVSITIPTDDEYRKYVPQHRRLEKLNEMMAPGNDFAMASSSRQPNRRNRLSLQIPRSITQRLLMAIVVVRALAGGLDGRMVDWNLVSNCFPEQDPKFIQDKGKIFLNKNRLQIAKMQSDFQERFIEAYARDEVPSINYDDLEGYDWDKVIDWATTQLDAPRSEKIPDLPATREQFDKIFELRKEPLGALDEVYQNQSITLNRKRALFAAVPFAVPLAQQRPARISDIPYLEVVKSWLRANITTHEDVYRPADARDALEYIDRGLLGAALESLVTERVISRSDRGRVVPGRNYDITEHFLFTLSKRRSIEKTELRRATRFKTDILDPTLANQGVYDLNYHAEDGDILALINLFATEKITLTPRDPPRDKFGLTEGGYLTRQIDKDKLRFAVEIHPVSDTYVPGNPIQDKVSNIPPPCPPRVTISETTSVPEKIPLWYDIHGGFIKVLWDSAVAAVIGCVATRPGITVPGITGMLKPTMGAWEIQMLLEWMEEVGVVFQGSGDGGGEAGWGTKEWWWMVLG